MGVFKELKGGFGGVEVDLVFIMDYFQLHVFASPS